jgi:hypothetical protein
MLQAVVDSFDPAVASPALRTAAGHVLAVATAASPSASARPEDLLPILTAAIAEVAAVVPGHLQAGAISARLGKSSGGAGRRGGPELAALLRRGAERHWQVHGHLIKAEVDQVMPREGAACLAS